MAEAAMAGDGRVSAEEVARFGRLAPRWWDERGPMRPLHAMNALRVGWILDRLGEGFGDRDGAVLDLGCGGGIATEALARAGLRVTGVDASAEAIGVARLHAAASGLDIDYRIGLASDLLAGNGLEGGGRFAAITALEIIEHVPDQAAFMAELAALLGPGGKLFVSTLNRTWRSMAFAKVGAEYVARLLPVGTHDWRRFVKPDELAAMGRAAGLRLDDLSGMVFTPSAVWRLSRDSAINYIACFVRC